MYRSIRLFTHSRKFVPEIVSLWLKNRNQRVDTGGGCLYEGELIRGVTQVLRKGWPYQRGGLICRGAYLRRNTVCLISQWRQILFKRDLEDYLF